MAAFLRNLVLTLTAVTLLEHLLPSGPMGRMGRMVLGLALVYTLLSSLNPGQIQAAWDTPLLMQGQSYQAETYASIALEGLEGNHGS